MRNYLREAVQNCRKNGYVETMCGRRRYLPSIHSNNMHARAHVRSNTFVLFFLFLFTPEVTSSFVLVGGATGCEHVCAGVGGGSGEDGDDWD